METIKRSVLIGEDGRLILDGLPAGQAEIVIEVKTNGHQHETSRREQLRQQMRAAGMLVLDDEEEDPDLRDIPVMSDEEEEAFGRTLTSARTIEDDVHEEREERF